MPRASRIWTSWLIVGLLCQWSVPAASQPAAAPAEVEAPEPEEPEEDDAQLPSPEATEPEPAPAPSADGSHARVSVLPILVSGETSDAAREALRERLRKGLARGAFELIDQARVDAIADTGCADDGCYKRLQEETGTTYLVRTFVTIRDRDYRIKIDLVDVRSGNVVATSEEGCELCGVAEVGSVLEAQGAQLRKKLEDLVKEPPVLVITSKPAGALVMVDGNVVGVTPVERTMLAGDHVVRVSYDGYIPEERDVNSVHGVREAVDIELKRTPESKRYRALGWAALATGLPTIAGGAALVFLDGREVRSNCTGDNVDAAGNCKFVYQTKWGGTGLIAAGAALTAIGIMLLVRYSDRRGKARKRQARILPTGLGLRAHF